MELATLGAAGSQNNRLLYKTSDHAFDQYGEEVDKQLEFTVKKTYYLM